MLSLALALCLSIMMAAPAAEPTPSPFVRLTVNGVAYANGAEIVGRPGERMELVALVFGGRRAWCMEPQRYANMGRNTVIESNSQSGLTFTTGPEFRGVWALQSETASWSGSLASGIRPDAGEPAAASATLPAAPGRNSLEVKVEATWHYDRYAQGNHVEQVEKNEAKASFTVVVPGAAPVPPPPPGAREQEIRLAKKAKDTARGRAPSGRCYDFVRNALKKVYDVDLEGASAYMAAGQLEKNDRFEEVKGLRAADLVTLPAGQIVVWDKGPNLRHGHISITTGDGHEVSDSVLKQNTNLGTTFRVFRKK